MHAKEHIVDIDLARISDFRIDQPLQVVHGVEIKSNRVHHRKFD
jgi:hypothetical protein